MAKAQKLIELGCIRRTTTKNTNQNAKHIRGFF